MSRRRLRVFCSSDEEDEQPPPPPPPPPLRQQYQKEENLDEIIIDDIETDFQTVTLNSANPTPGSYNSTTNATHRNRSLPTEPIPLDISDDEGNFAENDNASRPNYGSTNDNHAYFGVSDAPINGVLERLGLRLKKEWLDSCLSGLQTLVRGFPEMDDSSKAKLCFEQFLHSDMNHCGAGVLPPNVSSLHLVDLKGPFVLQVDEIVNISCPLRGRYQNAAPGIKRCLKLSMTDGIQRVFGMEYRPIKDLEFPAPAGLKLALFNVNIRHGLLMLVPEVLEVLGGSVEQLDAARLRLVSEINKPPRGKRNRTGEALPLATRATLAAWPGLNVPNTENLDSTAPATSHASDRGAGSGISSIDRRQQSVPESGNHTEPSRTSSAPRPQGHPEVQIHVIRTESTPFQASGQGMPLGNPANESVRDDLTPPMRENSFMPNPPAPQPQVTVPQQVDEPAPEVILPVRSSQQTAEPGVPANYMSGEHAVVPPSMVNVDAEQSSTADMDIEDITILDELEHSFIFSKDKEIPFTYLASLSAKCAAVGEDAFVVRGKIKCFLTGVKGFRYKQRTTYELQVYVDDGSLISEILIDHNVVQKGIGYSPPEVTSALTASDPKRVSQMKETLKQFQVFLVNFEGTMLIEMNTSSPVPVAVEINQGCSASDASLLLKRVKSYTYPQRRNHSWLNPIDLSP